MEDTKNQTKGGGFKEIKYQLFIEDVNSKELHCGIKSCNFFRLCMLGSLTKNTLRLRKFSEDGFGRMHKIQ